MVDFNTDLEFSKKFTNSFDEYYKSENFNKLLQKLRKKGTLKIVKIDRSNNILFQKDTHLDVILVLSDGTNLNIDEKVLRYKDPKTVAEYYYNKYPVEISSNPKYNHAGWAYVEGTLIVMARSNKDKTGFYNEPLLFRTSRKLIEEINRNKKYYTCPAPWTNGLYRSICKLVPREVLERYYP